MPGSRYKTNGAAPASRAVFLCAIEPRKKAGLATGLFIFRFEPVA
jgi:hypothetical protein